MNLYVMKNLVFWFSLILTGFGLNPESPKSNDTYVELQRELLIGIKEKLLGCSVNICKFHPKPRTLKSCVGIDTKNLSKINDGPTVTFLNKFEELRENFSTKNLLPDVPQKLISKLKLCLSKTAVFRNLPSCRGVNIINSISSPENLVTTKYLDLLCLYDRLHATLKDILLNAKRYFEALQNRKEKQKAKNKIPRKAQIKVNETEFKLVYTLTDYLISVRRNKRININKLIRHSVNLRYNSKEPVAKIVVDAIFSKIENLNITINDGELEKISKAISMFSASIYISKNANVKDLSLH
ncbi:hypothetical protein RF11_02134 [Thelohanellus kitauei]|uniref:Uncharacterized protein n=1 Tax=Thelohanellus kitauei TaxID=669202 RepID=A0A0C2I627_THEKT|nr:hypothetical protein RF11_02134 [Thelohanellus kitauei]